MYAPSQVPKLASTAPAASPSSASTSKPTYYPSSENVPGSLFTCDANRIWTIAPRLSMAMLGLRYGGHHDSNASA